MEWYVILIAGLIIIGFLVYKVMSNPAAVAIVKKTLKEAEKKNEKN